MSTTLTDDTDFQQFEVYVRVSGIAFEPEDEGVQGLYGVELSCDSEFDLKDPVVRVSIAEHASQAFHNKIAIECLDDFYIEYFDQNGEELDQLSDRAGVTLDLEAIVEEYPFYTEQVYSACQTEVFDFISLRHGTFFEVEWGPQSPVEVCFFIDFKKDISNSACIQIQRVSKNDVDISLDIKETFDLQEVLFSEVVQPLLDFEEPLDLDVFKYESNGDFYA